MQLDSSSFFHDLAPGVENDGTGLIVALAAAKALGAVKRNVGYFRFADLLARNGKFLLSQPKSVGLSGKCQLQKLRKQSECIEVDMLKWLLASRFLMPPGKILMARVTQGLHY